MFTTDPTSLLGEEITSTNQLGAIATVHTLDEMHLGDKHYHNFVIAVSGKYTTPSLTGQGEASVVFLLIDNVVSENVKTQQAALSKEEYRDIIRCIRDYVVQQYNTKPVSVEISRDLILNVIKSRKHTLNTEQRNDTEKRIDALLLAAHKQRASDIHISCGDKAGDSKIKFRLDGELSLHGTEGNQDTISDLVSVLYGSLAAEDGAIKDMGFDSKKKQDGVLYRTVENMRLGARIASHPTENKDKNFVMVLRVLGDQNASAARIPFNKLGFLFNQSQRVKQSLYGKGIVLIVGETNSGKSVTMENMLMEIDEIAHGSRHILSIENPVERQIKGVNQFNLIDSGATTEEALASAFNTVMEFIVRGDPDDVAVGEIRDKSTCQAAQQLALTGHNVMATMHCDSPFDVVSRMVGLGANERQILTGNTMKAVISQKLFKQLCPHCSHEVYDLQSYTQIQQQALLQLSSMGLSHKFEQIRFRNTAGCPKCNHRGINGRRLVAEVVEFTPQIVNALTQGDKYLAQKLWLEDSGFSKKDIALACVFSGIIDPTDVIEQLSDLSETYFFRKECNINHPAEIYE